MYGIVNNHKIIRKSFIYHFDFGIMDKKISYAKDFRSAKFFQRIPFGEFFRVWKEGLNHNELRKIRHAQKTARDYL